MSELFDEQKQGRKDRYVGVDSNSTCGHDGAQGRNTIMAQGGTVQRRPTASPHAQQRISHTLSIHYQDDRLPKTPLRWHLP